MYNLIPRTDIIILSMIVPINATISCLLSSCLHQLSSFTLLQQQIEQFTCRIGNETIRVRFFHSGDFIGDNGSFFGNARFFLTSLSLSSLTSCALFFLHHGWRINQERRQKLLLRHPNVTYKEHRHDYLYL